MVNWDLERWSRYLHKLIIGKYLIDFWVLWIFISYLRIVLICSSIFFYEPSHLLWTQLDSRVHKPVQHIQTSLHAFVCMYRVEIRTIILNLVKCHFRLFSSEMVKCNASKRDRQLVFEPFPFCFLTWNKTFICYGIFKLCNLIYRSYANNKNFK